MGRYLGDVVHHSICFLAGSSTHYLYIFTLNFDAVYRNGSQD